MKVLKFLIFITVSVITGSSTMLVFCGRFKKIIIYYYVNIFFILLRDDITHILIIAVK